jgi:hypothetical protein
VNANAPRIAPALWPEVSRRFDEALDLPPGERAAWLRGLDGVEPPVLQALQRLLDADASTQDPGLALGELALQALSQRQAGQHIGPYRLECLLGEGGMAQVWRAQGLQGLNRSVALKLPRPGAGLAERFARERDLLASLEHPHIARLYDAGVDGEQPWLALECVQGQALDRWAAGQPLAQRLRLYVQVLNAVAYAHQRLVVHCDLKPANLLVTAEGHLRLLDFGIAGLLGEPGGELLAFSADSAAPEQLEGAAPSTAMDVHALGVLLYELLAGRRPYRLARAPRAELAAERRAWRWQPTGADAALDAIAARAMAVDPARRYASVEALRDELLRWQRHEPVEALLQAGAGRAYRWRCWLHRHRGPVLAAGAVLLALVGGLLLALWQAQQAQAQARRAEAAQRFLVDLFRAASPEQRRDAEPRVSELLERGSRRLAQGLADEPQLRATLHLELARIHSALGASAEALGHARQAQALFSELDAGNRPEALDAAYIAMETLKEEGQYAQAVQAAEQLRQRAQQAHGPLNRWRLPLAEQLAWMANQQGDARRAEALVREALQTRQDGDALARLRLRSVLGSALLDQARLVEAAATFERVIAEGATLPQYERSDQFADRYNLARARYLQGQTALAERLLRALVPEHEALLGRAHDRVLKSRSLWAQALALLGRPLEAVAVQRDTLAAAEARPAFDESQLALQRLTLAKLLRQAHRSAEGLPLAEAGLAFMTGQQGAPTWLRERARWIVGELHQALDQRAAALRHFDEAEAQMRQLPGWSDHPLWAELLLSRALLLQRRAAAGDRARARVDADTAAALLRRVQGEGAAGARQAAAVQAWLAGDLARLRSAWPEATPLQRAGLKLWQAELLQGQPRETAALREQARAAWHDATGQALPLRLLTLP